MSTIFNTNATHHLEADMFFDENGGPEIARYDQVKYPQFETFTEKQLSFFWRPQEIDLSKDKLDFRELPPEQQHIFTSNLFRQIALDSMNGRGPILTFLPLIGLPEVEVWITAWGANETIHSRAYTHIIKNVYPNPSEILDGINDVKQIIECADDVSSYYDELYNWNALRAMSLNKEWFKDYIKGDVKYSEFEHKKKFWMALNCVNFLEGLRFYVSFACSWNFAEQKKMEGNAKEIKLICRDENLHLGSTQYMLRTLPKDYPEFASIKDQCADEVLSMCHKVIKQEKEWAKYLFKDGSMIGLNEEILCQYVDFIASRRMKTIGVPVNFEYPTSDPLPWTKSWISGKEVQVAPQESEIVSYLISDIEQDMDEGALDGLSL